MNDHKLAIDRLVERLTGVWVTAMLRRESEPDQLGFHVKAAMTQTETLTQAFVQHVMNEPEAKPEQKSQPQNGKVQR